MHELIYTRRIILLRINTTAQDRINYLDKLSRNGKSLNWQ